MAKKKHISFALVEAVFLLVVTEKLPDRSVK